MVLLIDMEEKKLTLDEEVEVEDGYLEAHVGKGHVYIKWVSKNDSGINECLAWHASLREAFLISVQERNPRTLECPLSNAEPTHLLKYRNLFENVHRDIDKLVKAYDSNLCINLGSV